MQLTATWSKTFTFTKIFKNFALSIVILILSTLGLVDFTNAKVQVAHIGIGVTNIGPGFSSPQISVEWQMDKASSLEGMMGIDTLQNSNSLSLGARFNRHLFIEESLDYSVYLGGGLMNQGASEGTSSSGFFFEAGGMANVYLSGLPNLGIQLGSGLRMESPTSSRIRTVFFSGFHYYF